MNIDSVDNMVSLGNVLSSCKLINKLINGWNKDFEENYLKKSDLLRLISYNKDSISFDDEHLKLHELNSNSYFNPFTHFMKFGHQVIIGYFDNSCVFFDYVENNMFFIKVKYLSEYLKNFTFTNIFLFNPEFNELKNTIFPVDENSISFYSLVKLKK